MFWSIVFFCKEFSTNLRSQDLSEKFAELRRQIQEDTQRLIEPMLLVSNKNRWDVKVSSTFFSGSDSQWHLTSITQTPPVNHALFIFALYVERKHMPHCTFRKHPGITLISWISRIDCFVGIQTSHFRRGSRIWTPRFPRRKRLCRLYVATIWRLWRKSGAAWANRRFVVQAYWLNEKQTLYKLD